MSAPRLTGACYCRAVRYEVADEFVYAQNCHCSDCRRATGSAFKPFGGIERAKLRVTHGADQILRYGNDNAHDVRCRACGSLVYSVVRESRWIHVALGSLQDAPALRPTCHIWVSDKAPWFTITDGLPQHAGFPP